MPDQDKKSPEDWEAQDIIESLKRTIPAPGEPFPPMSPGVCQCHTNTLIWIVRHMDRKESNNLSTSAVVSTLIAGVVIGLVEAARYFVGSSTGGR